LNEDLSKVKFERKTLVKLKNKTYSNMLIVRRNQNGVIWPWIENPPIWRMEPEMGRWKSKRMEDANLDLKFEKLPRLNSEQNRCLK
jgi:hypothetical protein